MHSRISRFVSLACLVCACAGWRPLPATAASPPNIILVMTDDQGWGDVGAHGNDKIRTPNLDRFAREGVQMTRFYVNPVCAPTRASLMTGRHYYRTGVIHTSRGGAKMHGDEVTVAEMLGKAGYRTGIFGKWHLGDNYPMRPQDQGFQEVLVHRSGGLAQPPDQHEGYFDPQLFHNGQAIRAKGYCTDVFFEAAMQFIEANRERPFFVYIPTNAPHTPLEVAEELVEPYRKAGLDETTARVYAMVENIDTNFGKLTAHLSKLGIRDNTLVLFITDNGPQQPRYVGPWRGLKASTYEGGIRVPCFIQWPARLSGGRKIDRLAAHVDLMSTFASLAGVDPASLPPQDGVSLVPLWTDDAAKWPARTMFFQVHRGLSPQAFQNCAVVTERYKMVGNPGTFNRETLPPGELVLELYDLVNDPGEKTNLAAEQTDTLAKLRSAYERWFADVQSQRHFAPGVIELGTPAENPARLCLYQDGNWKENKASGWTVKIAEPGQYRITLVGELPETAMTITATWLGKSSEHKLAAGERTFELPLAAGEGTLDITSSARRPDVKHAGTFSDVDVEKL